MRYFYVHFSFRKANFSGGQKFSCCYEVEAENRVKASELAYEYLNRDYKFSGVPCEFIEEVFKKKC